MKPQQPRQKIRSKRAAKREAKRALKREARSGRVEPPGVPVNVSLLAPNNSYGVPDFVRRGYYVGLPFTCKSCGKEEVWSPTQQKWWYEIAKGYVYSTATRCRPCRRRERERSAAAREIHLEGIARKRAASK